MQPEFLLALTLIGFGIVGCFVPLLPGPPLAWVGVVYYSWSNGFATPPLWVLVVLFLVMLGGSTADLWMGFLGARKGGSSFWGQLGATVGSVVGFFVLNVPGLVIGSLVGIVGVEYYLHRDWKRVFRVGTGYLVGYLLAAIVELVCVVFIAAVFLWLTWPNALQ